MANNHGCLLLTGMMGAGKSVVARHLADALGWRLVELDDEIEARSGVSIPSIFAQHGESRFREMEREALGDLCALPLKRPMVLSMGGGAYVQEGIADWLRSVGTSVYLEVPAGELFRRVENDSGTLRPLLDAPDPKSRLRAILETREGAYRRADRTVDGTGTPEEVAGRVLTRAGAVGSAPDFVALEVGIEGAPYPIWIGDEGAGRAGRLTGLLLRAAHKRPRRVVVVSDENVAGHYLEDFQAALAAGPWTVEDVVVPPGEETKSARVLASLWEKLIHLGLDRDDALVALGGGVVGDLTGFAAASYMRGIRWVQVPTTVLSIVDSSVGGKTGINHSGGKNLVGAFHQPVGVVVGPQMLRTLPPREISSGLAEVVKYGVLEGGDLLEALEREAEALVSRPGLQGRLFSLCCEVKAKVVAADEREQGVRALLNLGHTFGHAMEAMDGYGKVTHGEAVAMGMVLADCAARVLGIATSDDLGARLSVLLPRLGLPVDSSAWISRPEAMARWMGMDKKSRGDHLDLILPRRAGDVVRHRVEKAELPSLLREIADRRQRDYSMSR